MKGRKEPFYRTKDKLQGWGWGWGLRKGEKEDGLLEIWAKLSATEPVWVPFQILACEPSVGCPSILLPSLQPWSSVRTSPDV